MIASPGCTASSRTWFVIGSVRARAWFVSKPSTGTRTREATGSRPSGARLVWHGSCRPCATWHHGGSAMASVTAICFRTRSARRCCIPVACWTLASSGAGARLCSSVCTQPHPRTPTTLATSPSATTGWATWRGRRAIPPPHVSFIGMTFDPTASLRRRSRERRLRTRPLDQLQQAGRPGEVGGRSRRGTPLLPGWSADRTASLRRRSRERRLRSRSLDQLRQAGRLQRRLAGDPAAARKFYPDGLQIAQRLYDAAPENADYARDLSISYDRLGDLARSAGDPAAARKFYQDGLLIRQRLYDAAPENADYARDLSISYERLGDLARSAGDPAAARRFYQDGLQIRQRLYDAAPENADYARDLSISYNKLGDLARSAGDPAAARKPLSGWTPDPTATYDAALENRRLRSRSPPSASSGWATWRGRRAIPPPHVSFIRMDSDRTASLRRRSRERRLRTRPLHQLRRAGRPGEVGGRSAAARKFYPGWTA